MKRSVLVTVLLATVFAGACNDNSILSPSDLGTAPNSQIGSEIVIARAPDKTASPRSAFPLSISPDSLRKLSLSLDAIARHSAKGEESVKYRRAILQALAQSDGRRQLREVVKTFPVTIERRISTRDRRPGEDIIVKFKNSERFRTFIPTSKTTEVTLNLTPAQPGNSSGGGFARAMVVGEDEPVCSFESSITGLITGECSDQGEEDFQTVLALLAAADYEIRQDLDQVPEISECVDNPSSCEFGHGTVSIRASSSLMPTYSIESPVGKNPFGHLNKPSNSGCNSAEQLAGGILVNYNGDDKKCLDEARDAVIAVASTTVTIAGTFIATVQKEAQYFANKAASTAAENAAVMAEQAAANGTGTAAVAQAARTAATQAARTLTVSVLPVAADLAIAGGISLGILSTGIALGTYLECKTRPAQ